MPTTSSSVLFAASFCAAVAAQDAASPAIPAPAQPEATGNDAGGGGAPELSMSAWLDQRRPQQEPDYTLRGLFQQHHGDFMLRRERFDPAIELRAQSLTAAGVQHESGHFDLLRFHGDVEVPLMVSTDAYITLGAFYEGRHFQAKNMVGFGDEAIYSAGMKVGFGWFLDNDVLLEGMITPGTWSDWDGTLHHQDFDFPGSLLATVRYSDELFWKIGARYNEVFEDANILPYVGFSWVTESVRVDLLLPEMFEVSLWPSPDFGILFGAEIQGAEYHVRSDAATGHQQADVRLQEVLLYTGALWRMNDYTSIGVRAGAAVAGDYKLDEGIAATKRVTGTLDPSLFLEVSFGIDF